MPSEQEEGYFKERNREKILEARREQQLAAIRQHEKDSIRQTLESSEEVADEALELGFDAQTARVLPLVPVIQMAWADGRVSNAEGRQLLEVADEFGIASGSPAHEFLKLLLSDEPSNIFFERVDRVIGHLVDEEPSYWDDKSVVDLCRDIAKASGGFFNLADPINEDERNLLARFAKLFAVDHQEAGQYWADRDD